MPPHLAKALRPRPEAAARPAIAAVAAATAAAAAVVWLQVERAAKGRQGWAWLIKFPLRWIAACRQE